MAHTQTTSATCPTCNTDFASVPLEFDGPVGYAVLEATPCAECGEMLCAVCAQFACESCGATVCQSHLNVVTDATTDAMNCCSGCAIAFAAQDAEEIPLPRKIEPQRELLPALAARCPECQSANLRCVPYDFGVGADTGYHDQGDAYECRACGATGDAGDVVLAPALPELLPVRRDVASALRAAVARIA